MSTLSRRQVVGALSGAAAGLALAGAATAATAATDAPGPKKAGGHEHPAGPAPFDEVFEGRRIQGLPARGSRAAHAHHGSGYRVLIDGRELHLMHRTDGTWTSAVNHYETFRTPYEAARTAVTSLQGADLVPLPTA
ncbi:apotyrosinase chaperone MelC1 [Streptomyces yaizuensis]|uniref:Tyrosinase cofactor n=1 Tax=Streptomyces yaizuensis TaxID=2989713 RepID=A0ABQ5NRS5_9ACTN|nr:tyrosinase cofactor [Streptomyces sp. YSPA8]GLF93078.1 tyrosinase cofactor [Streptomyces sp. YSPA8]